MMIIFFRFVRVEIFQRHMSGLIMVYFALWNRSFITALLYSLVSRVTIIYYVRKVEIRHICISFITIFFQFLKSYSFMEARKEAQKSFCLYPYLHINHSYSYKIKMHFLFFKNISENPIRIFEGTRHHARIKRCGKKK